MRMLRALLAIALFASVTLAAFAVVPVWVALALFAVVLVVNGELFGLFRRWRGFAFALGATLFHQVYYLYASGRVCTMLDRAAHPVGASATQGVTVIASTRIAGPSGRP